MSLCSKQRLYSCWIEQSGLSMRAVFVDEEFVGEVAAVVNATLAMQLPCFDDNLAATGNELHHITTVCLLLQ